jgi:hypothetical protein
MRITNAYSPQIARAYGVGMKITPAPPTGSAGQISSPDAATQARDSHTLVAGKVSQQPAFDSVSLTQPPSLSPSGAFQMYTRAADKIEAAVAVQIGRTIDTRG